MVSAHVCVSGRFANRPDPIKAINLAGTIKINKYKITRQERVWGYARMPRATAGADINQKIQ